MPYSQDRNPLIRALTETAYTAKKSKKRNYNYNLFTSVLQIFLHFCFFRFVYLVSPYSTHFISLISCLICFSVLHTRSPLSLSLSSIKRCFVCSQTTNLDHIGYLSFPLFVLLLPLKRTLTHFPCLTTLSYPFSTIPEALVCLSPPSFLSRKHSPHPFPLFSHSFLYLFSSSPVYPLFPLSTSLDPLTSPRTTNTPT